MLLGIVVNGVFMAPEDTDGIAADTQARPGNKSLVNGVTHRRVGRSGALGAHVSLSRKSRHQIVSRVQHRRNGALRNRFLNGLKVFRAGVQEQMDVHIDKARHQGAVAKVDGRGAIRMPDFDSGFRDSISLNKERAGSQHATSLDIQKAAGVEHGCGLRTNGSQCEKEDKYGFHRVFPMMIEVGINVDPAGTPESDAPAR